MAKKKKRKRYKSWEERPEPGRPQKTVTPSMKAKSKAIAETKHVEQKKSGPNFHDMARVFKLLEVSPKVMDLIADAGAKSEREGTRLAGDLLTLINKHTGRGVLQAADVAILTKMHQRYSTQKPVWRVEAQFIYDHALSIAKPRIRGIGLSEDMAKQAAQETIREILTAGDYDLNARIGEKKAYIRRYVTGAVSKIRKEELK